MPAKHTIFVTGQCTLHWGRLEYGNIGNYYVIEPLFDELRRRFPNSQIKTTFQLTETFRERRSIVQLPMKLFYGWTHNDLSLALQELEIAEIFSQQGHLPGQTPFINEVLSSDLFVDFSGDMWGKNADLVGDNRFIIGLLKARTAQLLQRKTAMIAGSPGPFHRSDFSKFAKRVFAGFDLVTNREAISTQLLNSNGFDTSKTHDCACPAFLFRGVDENSLNPAFEKERLFVGSRKKIGFILCGWNMQDGPFSKWPRDDLEFERFVCLAEHALNTSDSEIYFLSHSNGFQLPPEFELIHGRDYPLAERMYELMIERGHHGRVRLIRHIYSPAETKTLLGKFDALISGRLHAAVASMAQQVPTIILDYGHEPKAHKLRGFADVVGTSSFLVDPGNTEQLLETFSALWKDRDEIKEHLRQRIPEVMRMARENFNLLSKLNNGHIANRDRIFEKI